MPTITDAPTLPGGHLPPDPAAGPTPRAPQPADPVPPPKPYSHVKFDPGKPITGDDVPDVPDAVKPHPKDSEADKTKREELRAQADAEVMQLMVNLVNSAAEPARSINTQ